MRTPWTVTLATFAITLSACGSGGGGEADAGGGGGDGGKSCTDACATLGETRCDGSVIAGCAIGDDGCLTWISGVDCAESGQICLDTNGPAACEQPVGTCTDGAQNQDETDIDCGGTLCDPCTTGGSCRRPEDCQSGFCDASGTCADAETCSDGVRNQDETDVDCGGSTCPACDDGKTCQVGSDCTSGTCDAGGTCVQPGTCTDNLQNQDETGVDCGGSTCPACPVGQGCQVNADCQSATCDVGQSDLCVTPSTPTCADGVQNQDETDVDCGGSCAPCALGEACGAHADCQSGVCDLLSTRTCITADPSYQVNEDFETGDFSRFPYTFQTTAQSTADNQWVIETDAAACHGGSYCARTNPLQGLGETSSFSVALSVRQDTQVTFWAKVDAETDQHFFRFYIDGVEQVAVTGQVDWTLYTFTVPATGPNGPDRVLTWEFSRSTYMDPNHPPWMEVWIDDIDMPDWNTPPSVPEVVRPWNGKLTTDPSPTFEWQSFDPDFDTITYELQYDTDPAFSLPFSTGETNDTQFTPPQSLADGTIYYWRVRAKDDSDYRWSAWGGPWAVQIDTTYEYDAVWRQSVDAEFQMDTLSGAAVVSNDQVLPTPGSSFGNSQTSAVNGASNTITFSNLVATSTPRPATLTIVIDADLNASTEYFDIDLEGTPLGRINPTTCHAEQTFTIDDINPYLGDGQVVVTATSSSQVDRYGCSGRSETIVTTLDLSGLPGSIVSTPIDFSLFAGKATWEKVQIEGSGAIAVQVLDGTGTPLPDTILPGNSTGRTERTVHLWNVEPRDYPVLVLKATLQPGAALDAWQVVGSDVYAWTFSHDGDDEGWIGVDRGVTPTLATASGVLRLDSVAAGDDPHIEYWFDQPVDASRFTTVEVRLRTSNNYNNDDVTFYWQSNYGLFDARRSFVHPNVFLLDMQDITFDLTVVPSAPGEPWRGQIEAIRIDPVVRFYDTTGNPADGWFEIDRIAIY